VAFKRRTTDRTCLKTVVLVGVFGVKATVGGPESMVVGTI